MAQPKSFSCYLIGSDTLLTQCGDILLGQGHEIRGVITDTPRLVTWARAQSLTVLDPSDDYRTELARKPFDYLFSITFLSILPANVVTLPTRKAINFHDGPLPRYAGLNAPAWALLNREQRYGISWHEINADGIDTGAILKQQLFDIDPRETSLGMNTRCFEIAIDTFSEIVNELAEDAVTPQPQDPSGRSYFSRHQRPAVACVLDFSQPASKLDAMVRALDYGTYLNPLGSPKLVHDSNVCVVTSAEAIDETTDADPGTILSVNDEVLRIATGEGVLAITRVETICAKALPLDELISQWKLRPDLRLDSLSSDDAVRLTELNKEMAKSEAAWIKRLTALEPVNLPSSDGESSTSDPAQSTANPIEVPASFTEAFGQDVSRALLAAFGFYLSRICDKTQFDLSLSDPALRKAISGFEHLIAPNVPLRIEIDGDADFKAMLDNIGAEWEAVTKRRSWLRDAPRRHPELHHHHDILEGRLVPVGVHIGTDGDDPTLPQGGILTLLIDEHGACRFLYDKRSITAEAIDRMCGQFRTILSNLAEQPNRPLTTIDILTAQERQRLLVDWNDTATEYPREATIHRLFEQQVQRTPDAIALAFEDQSVTYAELNARANQLAAHLLKRGVGPDSLVGVLVDRSVDLLVSILGILKAGGAYVPLDPAFPSARVAYMIEDSGAKVILTQESFLDDLAVDEIDIVCLDLDSDAIAHESNANPESQVHPENLAYVIYTSGSTGKPKGVMVEHRNVVNFFAGMDQRISHEEPGVWLAVTSLSFDISVLELFWTLARGFKIVLFKEQDRTAPAAQRRAEASAKTIDFSLFYFASDEGERAADKYKLLLEGAKFADRNGFVAVSTPERHFHAFGGLYPNPSVAGAALASITENIQIRAGSVVLPLHHPIRIAEEWALVDNLSKGRVGIAFASGWQPVDFVIRPESYQDRYKVMYEGIETIRKLWRGESVAFPDANGDMKEIRTLPRPIQDELPIWITTAGNPETWRSAGTIGANILTHLLGQTVQEIAEKITLYREARREAGFDPATGRITLMLHTFVGDDLDFVRETVSKPMKDYLASSLSLVKNVASSWAAFKRRSDGTAASADIDITSLPEEEMQDLLDFSFERYFETSSLFGTPESCLDMVDDLKLIGVDEIACLIDFGIDSDTVLAHLYHLNKVRKLSNETMAEAARKDYTISDLIREHAVTHLQCTPSMASMMLHDNASREALRSLKTIMIGGETFPVALARELTAATDGDVINMYGPTETTIWSSTEPIRGDESSISIGRPIANTQLYILDANLHPLPVGVPGHLYIGGAGVVRGYHGLPELTSERFIPHPFRNDDTKIYATGDIARWLPDGRVDFLGRADHQVKIRGYRIELGEIETLLTEQPSLREAVVITREDTPGDVRLVAYLIAETDHAIDAETLRDELRGKLPEYMVPAHFVVLDAYPLTPNRKVDRKALPAPDRTVSVKRQDVVAPTNEIEKTIIDIWKDILGIQQAGIEDNFFDLGGHSLLAVKTHRRLSEALERTITITDLFRYPTVRALAGFLDDVDSGAGLRKSEDRAESRREMMSRRRQMRTRPRGVKR